MPETLETIASSLRDLRRSMDEQFKKVDQKIDQVKSHVEIKIEAVQDTVNRVYDVSVSHQQQFGANEQAHETFTRRLDAHDLRILRLESRKATDR